MHKIYIELVLLDNFALDFAIMLFGLRMSGKRASFPRAAAGGAVGAVYAATAAALPLLTLLPFKLAAFLAMCAAAMLPMRPSAFFAGTGRAFAIALLFGGAVLGATFLFGGSLGSGYVNLPGIRYAVIGMAIAAFCLELLMRHRYPSPGRSYRIYADVAGERLCLRGFVDTGNGLKDFAGNGAIVADRRAVEGSLSDGLVARIKSGDAPVPVHTFLYRAVGANGELVGFLPDSVTIAADSGKYAAKCYIVIGDGISKDGMNALLSPDIVLHGADRRKWKENVFKEKK